MVDPGKIKFDEKFLKTWKDVDAILVTHKHGDHFYEEVLQDFLCPIYSTKEVQTAAPSLKIKRIKENDVFKIGNVKVEVVKAIHGFVAKAGEIKENVGFILDDGAKRLYITSDTIRFDNNYKADVLFANATAFDASMTIWGAVMTMKEVGAKLLIVAHQDMGKIVYDKEYLEKYLKEQGVDYAIPEIMETIEL